MGKDAGGGYGQLLTRRVFGCGTVAVADAAALAVDQSIVV